MTPRRFKCSQFRKGTLDFNFECINLLQNDFCKQRSITLNATISGQDRIYPKTHLCRTFFAEYTLNILDQCEMVYIFMCPALAILQGERTKPNWDKTPLGQNPTGQKPHWTKPHCHFWQGGQNPTPTQKGKKIKFEHFYQKELLGI